MGFMDGPPLATPADLAAFTQQTIPTAQAEVILRMASALVRRETGQQISRMVGDTVVLRGGARVLCLPQRPVVVDESNPLTVTELGGVGFPNLLAVENVTYTRVGDELTRYCGVWCDRVQVTYSHGNGSTPDDVLGVVLDVAGRIVANPSGLLRSVSIDDYTRVYATEALGAGAVLTDANRKALADFKRRSRSAVLS